MKCNWLERQKNIMAQGRTSPLSKDASQYIEGVFPSHCSGEGTKCYLYDAEGEQYIDFVGALGALSLGMAHPKVTEAAIRQIRKGSSFSLPTTLEVEVAEILGGLVACGEKWRFFKNGKDATECAVRIARTETGKEIVYSRGYHGSGDGFVSITPPALGIVGQHRFKNFESRLEIDFKEAAAVIVESIHLDDSHTYQKDLMALREDCRKNGVVFIVDEIITGFRVPKLTVSSWWNIDPDIICLGKGMANGFPLSAIGGKREIMDCGEWFVSTTFGGEAVSLAACRATIEEITQKNLEDLMFYGKRLQEKLNALHPEIQLKGYGTRAMLNTQNAKTQLFMQEAAKARFLFGKAFFFNFSHLEENIEERVMNMAHPIIDRIQRDEVKLEGKPPMELFKR